MLAICNITPIDEVQKVIDRLIYIRTFLKDLNRLPVGTEEHFENCIDELNSIIGRLSEIFDE